VEEIGRNMVIIGKVESSEELDVDGEVQGALEAASCRLTIGPNGKANAGASAREVEVMVRIDGDVETLEKISIRKGGQLVVDIKAAGIVIEDGACFARSIDIARRAPEPPERTPEDSAKQTRSSESALNGTEETIVTLTSALQEEVVRKLGRLAAQMAMQRKELSRVRESKTLADMLLNRAILDIERLCDNLAPRP
jgi:cytoskeletal protein CcmA (bactofilin family)